jgi:hypothetical protein
MLDMGAFAPAPKDVTLYILLFLDARSLAQLAQTNSTFYEIINDLNPQIHIRIYNQEFSCRFTQFVEAHANYVQQKQARKNEINEIRTQRSVFERQKLTLAEWSEPSRSRNKSVSYTTDEEKLGTGCCCVAGLIGGTIISFYFPISCALSAFLGATGGGVTPLVISRTTKCLCGACLACKEEKLNTREDSLDSNYPTQLSMTK